METNNVTLTSEAVMAIVALQQSCGTYDYYRSTLDRLYTYVLHQSDEIGMSANEAISTLRALDSLRTDIAAIAGQPTSLTEIDEEFSVSCDEVTGRVQSTFALVTLDEKTE